jgi:hypothetical protein
VIVAGTRCSTSLVNFFNGLPVISLIVKVKFLQSPLVTMLNSEPDYNGFGYSMMLRL